MENFKIVVDGAGSNLNINPLRITPLTGKINDNITISGQNFFGVESVVFNENKSGDFVILSESVIVAQVPKDSQCGSITLTSDSRNATGTISTFAPFPVITGFSLETGTSGSIVTVGGYSFSGVSGMRFNNLDAESFAVVNGGIVTGMVPSGNTKGVIKLLGKSGTFDESSEDFGLQPIFSSVLPESGQVGSSVTISGLNFLSSTLSPISAGSSFYSVGFGGVNNTGSFKIIDQFSMSGAVPQEAKSGNLYNFKHDGVRKSNLDFHVLYSAPSLSTFFPQTGKSGQFAFSSGSNLYEIQAATFSGASLNPILGLKTNTGDGKTISFSIPSINPGQYDLIVSGNFGDARIVDALNIISGSNSSGYLPVTGSENTTLTLTGVNYYSTSRVFLNGTGTEAAIVASSGENSLTIALPFMAQTGVTITVNNGANLTTLAPELRYYTKPQISGFSPLSGTAADTIFVSGNFDAISGVKIGGTIQDSFSILGNTGINIIVKALSADGYIDIFATGGAARSTGIFNYLHQQPAFSGLTPITGMPGVTELKISGVNAPFVSKIEFSGASSSIVQREIWHSGDSFIFTTVPSGSVDGKLILVDGESRRTQSSQTFSVTNISSPLVSGFSPSAGVSGDGITISGSGLGSVSNCYFDGTDSTFIIGIDSNGNPNITGYIPGISPFLQDVQIKLVSPVGSSETGTIKIYTPNPHSYGQQTFISSGLNNSSSGFVTYMDITGSTGCLRMTDPQGNSILMSSFIIQ